MSEGMSPEDKAHMEEMTAILNGSREEYEVPVVANIRMDKHHYAAYKHTLYVIGMGSKRNGDNEAKMRENFLTQAFTLGIEKIVCDVSKKILADMLKKMIDKGE